MKHLLAALCLALAACAAPAAAPPAQTPAPAAQSADPAAACAARGGSMMPICRMQKVQCVIQYADAGRACRGEADCEGLCLSKDTGVQPGQPAAGRCQATSNPCGCNTPVEDGEAGPTLCVD
jgi:hypothetical protein